MENPLIKEIHHNIHEIEKRDAIKDEENRDFKNLVLEARELAASDEGCLSLFREAVQDMIDYKKRKTQII